MSFHVRGAITDAFRRAALPASSRLDGIETHDCFTSDRVHGDRSFRHHASRPELAGDRDRRYRDRGAHSRQSQRRIDRRRSSVGATGVRMALDCFKQVTGTAGDYQVEGANNFATLNIGGSATTTVSLIVGRA